MKLTASLRIAALAALLAAALTGGADAQTAPLDPHHPAAAPAPAPPSPEPGVAGQAQGEQPDQTCMMSQGMMGRGGKGGMPMMGMRGARLKIMFAIADTDGDGALSFQEVTALHKRIFDAMDVNKDGKATPDEVKSFLRE